jgi:endoglucanase Acf2
MPYTSRPDRQQADPKKPQFHLVSGRVSVGGGSNRIEIYPIDGETSERQMMVYFPEHHLLYGSDPFQQTPDGSFFYPQTVTELMDAVERNHLDVQKFLMMHVGVTPWSDLAKAVEKAKESNTPTGALM